MTRQAVVPDTHLQAGFSYLEVLVAIVLIALFLGPVADALRSGVSGVSLGETQAVDSLVLQSKIEEVLKEPFVSLDAAAEASGSPLTPTSYSDIVTTNDGRQHSRLVYLWPYDGDNADGDNNPFTGSDAGLLFVKVQIDGTPFVFETLTSW